MKLRPDALTHFSLESYSSNKRTAASRNSDTSKGQGVQIGREVQYMREDFVKFKEDFLALRAAELDKDSPYVQDRDSIDKTRLLDSPSEPNWKKVENPTSHPLVKNIKKLNII